MTTASCAARRLWKAASSVSRPKGDRRSDYLRSKGNYRAAENVEDRYEEKEERIEDQQARNARGYDRRDDNDGLTIQLN